MCFFLNKNLQVTIPKLQNDAHPTNPTTGYYRYFLAIHVFFFEKNLQVTVPKLQNDAHPTNPTTGYYRYFLAIHVFFFEQKSPSNQLALVSNAPKSFPAKSKTVPALKVTSNPITHPWLHGFFQPTFTIKNN